MKNRFTTLITNYVPKNWAKYTAGNLSSMKCKCAKGRTYQKQNSIKQKEKQGQTETDKKSTNLSLVGHHLNEVISTHIIHVWNKNRQEIRAMILWINVLLHSCVPVFPLTWGKFLEKFRTSRYDQLIKPQLHHECFAFYVAFDWNESHGGKRHIDSFQW